MSLLSELLSGKAISAYIGLLFFYYLSVRLQRWQVKRRFEKEYGCRDYKYTDTASHRSFGLHSLARIWFASSEGRVLETLNRSAKKRGYTFNGAFLTGNTIFSCDKENIKTVLNDRFNDWALGERIKHFGPLMGAGIFTTDGDHWKNSRSLIKPSFDRKQMANLEMFERHIQTLFKVIPGDGTSFDLQALFFRLTIDSSTEFLFGKCSNSLEHALHHGLENDTEFATAFNHAQETCSRRFRLSNLSFLHRDSKSEESNRICHRFVDEYVQEALEKKQNCINGGEIASRNSEKYLFLQELVSQTRDPRRLRNELLNILIAGRDTTASLLSNFFFVLARRQDIWEKLQKEVEVLNGDLPNFETLKSLTYLRWCLQESLRIHPVVPVNSRTAVRDTVLPVGGGPDGNSPVFVPKRTRLVYSTYVMHRRKDYFGPDADEFRPERWQNLRPGWGYLPFNGGPRVCVGQQYALTEASYVVVRILQNYRSIESRDMMPWVEGLALSCCSKRGTHVSLRAREE